jgi:hypothetical protein
MDFDLLLAKTLGEVMKFVSFSLLAIFFGFIGFAKANENQDKTDSVKTEQSSATKISVKNKSKTTLSAKSEKEKGAKWTQAVTTSISTDMKNNSDTSKAYESELGYSIKYNFNSGINIKFSAGIAKDLSDSYEDTLADSKLAISKTPVPVFSKVLYAPSVGMKIPTSDKSRFNDQLKFALELTNTFIIPFTDSLTFIVAPKVKGNFHEYTTSRTNNTNTQLIFQQVYAAEYAFKDNWYVSGAFVYANTWSYTGRRRDPSYLNSFELGFNVDKSFTVAAGTVQGGSLYNTESGPDKTIEFYDRDATAAYVQLSLKF